MSAQPTERFNALGILSMLEQEWEGSWQSERTKIGIVMRLIRSQETEIDRLRETLQMIGTELNLGLDRSDVGRQWREVMRGPRERPGSDGAS